MVNLLLHLFNTVLWFALLHRQTGRVGPSFLAAGLFGLHPIHVESVAWVVERKDVLSTAFWRLTLGAYLKYARGREAAAKPPATSREGPAPLASANRWYCVALICFALGLLAKPMLVTLPFVLLLLDVWPLRRIHAGGSAKGGAKPWRMAWPRLVVEKIPFFLLAAAAAVLTFRAQQGEGAVNTLERFPLADRLGNAAVAYVVYLGKCLFPHGLPVFEPHRHYPWGSSVVLGAVGVLALLTGLALAAGRKRPWFAVGWFWYLGRWSR